MRIFGFCVHKDLGKEDVHGFSAGLVVPASRSGYTRRLPCADNRVAVEPPNGDGTGNKIGSKFRIGIFRQERPDSGWSVEKLIGYRSMKIWRLGNQVEN